MHKEIAEILLKIQMDDLQDAQMLYDYAEEIAEHGDMALAQAINTRAKQRLDMYNDCSHSIEAVLERARMNGEAQDTDSMYGAICKEYLNHWFEKTKQKVHSM